MVPEDIRLGSVEVILSQRLIVQQPGGHSPPGDLQSQPPGGQAHLALVHYPGKNPLPLLLG